ncbi:hypothetical protein PS15m_009471 [Mucor circinelloides]
MLKSFFLITAACIATASALVWDAKIIEPKTGTKLTAGQTYTVKWNTEVAGMKIPDTVSGQIYLGYRGSDKPEDEHLDWKLAKDFPLSAGSVIVSIPEDLETRDTYIMSLMGDTGNISPYFTITANNDN